MKVYVLCAIATFHVVSPGKVLFLQLCMGCQAELIARCYGEKSEGFWYRADEILR
jgi:hypothetical protein